MTTDCRPTRRPPEAARTRRGPAAPPRAYDAVKPVLDFALALVLFVPALPVMFVCGLLVKLTSPGPAVYSQTRVGRDGRVYRIYKIRSMRHNCEAASGARWSSGDCDPRVTPVGRFLRRTHLDELPQLWNVLRGEMSLVGPRPERPEFVPKLEQLVPGYRERLRVKPGVTGLAQIQLPADTDVESVRNKLALDRRYVEGYGFWLDVRILLGTGLKVAGVPFAGIRRLLALPGPPPGAEAEAVVLPRPEIAEAAHPPTGQVPPTAEQAPAAVCANFTSP